MNEDIITTTDKIFYNIINNVLEKLSEKTKEAALEVDDFNTDYDIAQELKGKLRAYEEISKIILNEIDNYANLIKEFTLKNIVDS